jgi:peptidyl-prolyl cis-trans isomerase C
VSRWRSVRRLLAEPLPQFLLIGVALFALSGLRGGGDASDVILLGPAEVDYQRRLYRLQFGADPDVATLDRLTAQYVREEALFREARRLGLDGGDEIVRRRLVAKLEFLLSDSAVPPRPTDAELRAWWQGHPDRFALPRLASFEQIFYEPRDDNGTAQARAAAALAILRSGRSATTVAAVIVSTDAFPPGERFDRLDRQGVERVFGQSPFTAAVAESAVGEWTGPWRSGYGWHLLRVGTREEPSAGDFIAVRDAVLADWERDWREQRSAAAIDAVVARYRIERQAGPAPP